MDTCLAELKELMGKRLPKSLDQYDVIGFDVDHCLVQYNVPNLHAMTYRALSNVLVKERGYPASVQELTPEQLNFPLNALVCDKKTGCLIKLGENKLVLRAYFGFTPLSQAEVIGLKITKY